MCESSVEKEMALMGVLPAQNGAPESLESDYSIIPEPHLINGINEDFGTFEETSNLHSALMSATPDLSLEELQSHLADVVQENASLKSVLEKYNEKMQMQMQQLTAIMAWHDDLTTSMSKQQLELKEAQEKVADLEKKNEELQSKITEIESKPKSVDRAVLTWGNRTLVDEEVEFEIVERKGLQNNPELMMAYEKIAEMNEIVKKQTDKIRTLESAVNADTKLDLKDIDTQQLLEKIKTLENLLETKQKEFEEERNKHLEVKKQLNIVQTNYDRVTRLLQIQSKDENKKKFDEEEREKDTMMYLEKIDDLAVKLLTTEECLQEKEVIINGLTSDVEALKADSENVPLLKSQLELCKTELDKVSLEKEAFTEEVNRLTMELHQASSLAFCDSCATNISMNQSSSSFKGKGKKSMTSMKPISIKHGNNLHICPVCKTACTSLQALEKHVNDCLDQSLKSECSPEKMFF